MFYFKWDGLTKSLEVGIDATMLLTLIQVIACSAPYL